MGAAWFVALADARRRWPGAVVLTLLVAVVGAGVLASVAGARRTASSLARFEEATSAATFELSVGEPTPAQLRALRAVPEVLEVGRLKQVAFFNLEAGFLPTAGPVDQHWGRTIDRGRIVDGRRARGVHELDIGEGLARRLGIGIGDHITFASFTPAQTASDLTGFDPQGPDVRMRVVGLVRRPLDLGARGATGGVIVPTRAFMRHYEGRIGSFGNEVLRVRTRNGEADAGRVTAAARRIFAENPDFYVEGLGTEGQGARSAINLTRAALWAVATVVAVTGAIAIALAFARRMTDDAQEHDALRALGLTRGQRWALTALPVVPTAVVGGALAAVGGYLMSPLFPVGVARDAEPSPGLRVDGTALGVGVVGVVVVTLLVGAAVATFVTYRRPVTGARPSRAAHALADTGAPAPVSVGVAFALARPRGQVVPKWSVMVALLFGVGATVAALIFGATLHRLVSDPARYGWTWDVVLDGYGGADPCPARDPIGADRHLEAVAAICIADITVAGRPTVGSAIRPVRGRIDPPVITGRAPAARREVAVGRDVLDASGKHIGDSLVVQFGERTRRYRIVGTLVLASLGDAQPLASAVLFTHAGLARGGDIANHYVVVRLRDGVDRDAEYARLTRLTGGLPPSEATVPAEIQRIQQIDGLPALVAGLAVAIALIAVAYMLVVSVRRRRRDLAILKTVGFTRRQVRVVVAAQATTFAVVAVALGGLLGLVVGNAVWRMVAEELGVSTSPAVPVLALVTLVLVCVLVVNLVAAFPARTAAHTRPAAVLRSE